MPALALLPCLFALAAPLTAQSHVDNARELVKQVHYAEAAKALEAAAALGGMDLPTTLALYELSGIVAGAMKQPDKARAAFQVLISLNPKHELLGSFPPRVKTPYFEARSLVEQQGALELRALAPRVAGGHVEAVVLELVRDPLKLATSLRLHHRAPNASWAVQTRPASGKLELEVSGDAVEWWAELLGKKDQVIALLGSEAAPQVARAEAPPVAVAPAPALAPAPVPIEPPPPAPPLMTSEDKKPSRPLRAVSIASLAVGAGLAVVGGIYGLRSSSARSQLLNPELDASMVVVGMTRGQALDRDAAARSDAVVANALWVSAAALAVAAVVLWVLSY